MPARASPPCNRPQARVFAAALRILALSLAGTLLASTDVHHSLITAAFADGHGKGGGNGNSNAGGNGNSNAGGSGNSNAGGNGNSNAGGNGNSNAGGNGN